MTYEEFLETKIELDIDSGFELDESKINPALMAHQKDVVLWACRGGRRAVFAHFGMGKSAIQIEFCHQVIQYIGGKALIVMPLGVKQEFTHDAVEILGYDKPQYVKTMRDIENAADKSILLTNYERVRDGDIDPTVFTATSLDEASVLRSYGSKTFQTFLDKFKGVPYKMVATATPAPNRFKELTHYAGYLEIADTGNLLTRFFKRDSTKANNLTLYPTQAENFWFWMSSWALFLTKPSDIDTSYSDKGYSLPDMSIEWHKLPIEYGTAVDRDGQMSLFVEAAGSLSDAAKVKRNSLDDRVAKTEELLKAHGVIGGTDQAVIWVDLNDEQSEIEKMLKRNGVSYSSLYGSQDIDRREDMIYEWKNKETQVFLTKPDMYGQGVNLQQCHFMIFVGIDYKFEKFIQAIHREYRFGQKEKVLVDIIYMENESGIKEALLEKWKNHNEMVAKMTDIVKQYGLGGAGKIDKLKRKMGVKTDMVQHELWTAVNGDSVVEVKKMESNSVDLIHTSIPFGNHYEYSSNYADMGFNDDDQRFFEQMDYLTPELLRVLKPGRVAAIHVKDRVEFGSVTGTGFPTIEPFHADCIAHYIKHGFKYFGMITIVTDVVRENNQTYRLGWSEQCKDATKMGVGCPEYLLLFRKQQTNKEKGYADVPVVHDKKEYPLARWQLDAHAYWRSSGDRLPTREDIMSVTDHKKLEKLYKQYSRSKVYNFNEHLELAQKLDEQGKLPTVYMVVPPASWTDEVWDDVVRMRTLNSAQSLKGKENHVCLAEGSLILTRCGYKKIEDVKIGDLVLTHKGNWKPIIAKKCTGERETIQTKANGVPYLITTPDHKLWVRTTGTRPSRPKDGMKQTAPDWIEAQNAVGGYVNLKLPKVEPTNLTIQEWWIIGRYLADGHMGTMGDFFISVGKSKKEKFEEMAGEFFGTCAVHEALQYRLKGVRKELREILIKCGRGAENKQVPVEGLCLDTVYAESLLSGYLSGDGNVTNNCTSASSVSRALLLGMAIVAQRARGVIASVYHGRPERKSVICGREVNCKQEWVMSWRVSNHHHESIILDDGAWKKVKKSIPQGVKMVWSIQVEDDASYTAEGCIVKNCPLQLDIVDRVIERFSNKGDLVFDPFGGLGTVPYRAVEMGRRGYMIELNTNYYRDALGYLELAEQEVTAPTLFDMIDDEEAV